MEKTEVQIDAGLKSLDHYQQKLPSWRYSLRQKVLPLVRWETPYLAWFQERLRRPSLDSWFAITANLGTHTFYMVMLPILFWCGYTDLGRGFVHVLASGVIFSGFLKDMVCLPRPLSPPLNRITMSGSASLEYGFPSTHATNCVSVVYYAIFLLKHTDSTITPRTNIAFQAGLYIYALSIVIGRLYCGMHGFLDVICGSLLGAWLGFLQCLYGDTLDEFLFSGTMKNVFIIVLIILAVVRVHPEPADSCPCFDDSVAFAGVLIGVESGNWHFAKTRFALSEPVPATIPYQFQNVGWVNSVMRILIGVLIIFVWREVMKPSLLRFLPPLFRVIERLGLSLPRRFFTRASEYKRVPNRLKDDDVIPNVSEIPSMLTNIRHPRRRAISVGPQSEADAYETLAYREKRTREGNSDRSSSPNDARIPPVVDEPPSNNRRMQGKSPTRGLAEYEHMMGTGTLTYEKKLDSTGSKAAGTADGANRHDYSLKTQNEKEMFSRITRPRVRYDVEVVTKLIVYSGIGWLAVEGTPILFHYLGLTSMP